jgi:isopentenyl phosphate kinase
MSELIFLKLGGSLLTDKTRVQALREGVLTRLATEIAGALACRRNVLFRGSDLRLLIGHGSGSFGHVAASIYGTRAGVASPEQWRGYAETACAAAQLSRLVVEALQNAGVPALPIQPSASARCHDGELQVLDDRPLHAALDHDLVPVVYGDVALDDVRGGTIISTEQIFRWLAPRLAPRRILLVGEVPGVLSADPAAGSPAHLIEEITPASLPALTQMLGGSRGVDVTGGMAAKVAEMIALVQAVPTLTAIQIFSGLSPGLLREVLVNPNLQVGTRIRG